MITILPIGEVESASTTVRTGNPLRERVSLMVRVSLISLVVALVVAVPAFGASNSTLKSGYSSTPHQVAAAVAKKAPKSSVLPTVKATGTLPFTGTDLGLFAVGAAVLAGTGLAFRRLGRQND